MSVCRARIALGRSLTHSRPQSVLRTQPSRRYASTESSAPQTTSPRTQSKWRTFLQLVGRVTLVTVVGSGALFYYVARKDRTPGEQLPHDPTKKTLVVLGSGWGATSLLQKLDTTDYNVVISPRNYFLFTPLLPSVAVGTLNPHSIIQPTRYITRHKTRTVSVIEAAATDVDPIAKTVTFADESEIQGLVSSTTLKYDYLVYAVGAETQTFNIPGVKENACFMKELDDADLTHRRFLDCLESAAFPGQTSEEIDRLLHIVVVGGGPTGIELSGEVHDYLEEDLRNWYPELSSHIKISLVEALPSVLPMFSKKLIEYTESTFKEANIDILTKTMVKEIKDKSIVVQGPDGTKREIPCGMVVWAAGNTLRKVTKDLMAKLPEHQTNRRGLNVDDHLRLEGTSGSVFALGDCTATSYAPTAQVASQQGSYLARVFKLIARRDALSTELQQLESQGLLEGEKLKQKEDLVRQLEKVEKMKLFKYTHEGSLAYIGSEKAIADLPFGVGNLAIGGVATYLFWRSAYLSRLFSLRNRTLVASDWLKVRFFGRDVSRD
ncbi:unnamed protein product [Somion occarium]|uniref:NADH:ubiquinone reductase (non-electrogenic) n=1 Tax=Somion occarium TaxID=3059160 RepID=A0ABP1DVG0_9APHY